VSVAAPISDTQQTPSAILKKLTAAAAFTASVDMPPVSAVTVDAQLNVAFNPDDKASFESPADCGCVVFVRPDPTSEHSALFTVAADEVLIFCTTGFVRNNGI